MTGVNVQPTALIKVCAACGRSYSYDEAHSCTEGNSKLYQEELPLLQPEALVGAVLGGRYRIEESLEGGGMGVVYRARHVTLEKDVAVKIMVMREPQEEAARQRFLLEAVLASRVRHFNVVDIYDFGVLDGGHLYLVMEFLEGATLRQVLRQGPLPPARACHIAAQIARALQAVHDKGIIHRDLKPDNVFLIDADGKKDFIKLVDFGIAKSRGGPQLTQAGMAIGTPQYMSPEQVNGSGFDHRVDQYALGCVLYRMLTGELPFDGKSNATILVRHAKEPVQPPRQRRPELTIPAALEAVVLRTLEKQPEQRFSSMREVEAALLAVMNQPSLGLGPGPETSGGEPAAAREGAEAQEEPELPTRLVPLPLAQRAAAPPGAPPGLRWDRVLPFALLGAALSLGLLWWLSDFTRRPASLAAVSPRTPLPPTAGPPGSPAPPPRAPALEPPPRAAPPPARPAAVVEAPAAAPAAQRPRTPAQPLRVRFQVSGPAAGAPQPVSALVVCEGQAPRPCAGACAVPLPEGPGECVISAPGSGYQARRIPIAELRRRAQASGGSTSERIEFKYIRFNF